MTAGEPAGAGEARVWVEPLSGGSVRIHDRIDRPTFTYRPSGRVSRLSCSTSREVVGPWVKQVPTERSSRWPAVNAN